MEVENHHWLIVIIGALGLLYFFQMSNVENFFPGFWYSNCLYDAENQLRCDGRTNFYGIPTDTVVVNKMQEPNYPTVYWPSQGRDFKNTRDFWILGRPYPLPTLWPIGNGA